MAVERSVSETLRAHDALVLAAARAEPKAWGALAARGILRFKELTGRAPSDEERRAIWHGLWRKVETRRG